MFRRIDHVEIIPSDLERTIDFYTNILGFKIKERQRIEDPNTVIEEVVFLELNDTLLELVRVKNPAPVSPEHWQIGYLMIAIEIDNMDKVIEYLKSKGVGITAGPITLGSSKRAEIKDPDGLSIELRQW